MTMIEEHDPRTHTYLHSCPLCGKTSELEGVEAITAVYKLMRGHNRRKTMKLLMNNIDKWVSQDALMEALFEGTEAPKLPEKAVYNAVVSLNKVIEPAGWKVMAFREMGRGSEVRYMLTPVGI